MRRRIARIATADCESTWREPTNNSASPSCVRPCGRNGLRTRLERQAAAGAGLDRRGHLQRHGHAVGGMAGAGGNPMAALGGLFGGGGAGAKNSFGQTQTMSAGRWVDVTLYTRNNPSLAEAQQAVPAGFMSPR